MIEAMSPALPVKRFYWLSEVQPYLPYSLRTLYRMVESGQIRTVLPRKPYKLSRKEVEKILCQSCQS